MQSLQLEIIKNLRVNGNEFELEYLIRVGILNFDNVVETPERC